MADLLEELDDLVLRGGVCDEVVDVCDDVNADGAAQLVAGLGGGEGGGDEGRDEESKLHSDFFVWSGCLASEGRELEAGFIAPCFISSLLGDSLNSRERRRLFA